MIYCIYQLKEPSSTDGESGVQTTWSRRFVEADRLGSVARIVGFFRFQHNFCVVWRGRGKPDDLDEEEEDFSEEELKQRVNR